MMLVDQVHHGRPLVNWTMYPSDTNVPGRYRMMATEGELGFLLECERDMSIEPWESSWREGRSLQQLGVDAVYLDVDFLAEQHAKGRAYQACVERLLGQAQRAGSPYNVYLPPATSPGQGRGAP